ncbi:class I SAM-dependent methyltransferase [Clostridium paraputrificum]|uniref:class I SAM-dependent methyltransferase n=1 Tax=Clostridium paraputrificum TaxID=29363 RepID=UPI003D33E321
MDLVKEYENQNEWRQWERYLSKLPLDKNQTIYDLGCSIGTVSKLLSSRGGKVVGYDNDEYLLKKAMIEKKDNCNFILEDIFSINPIKLEKCHGIWISFVLAYAENPRLFISNWIKCLNKGGWVAIVDIDNLFSGHLSVEDRYLDVIRRFEEDSYKNKTYDFKIGSKIKDLMVQNGLEIFVEENDWYDDELNFKGSANESIIENWKARLDRMVNLKSLLGNKYNEFSTHFCYEISKQDHVARGCVKFYVGIKNY